MINHKMNFLKNGWSIIKSKDPKLIKQLFEIFKNQIKKNTDLNKDIKNKIKDIKSTRTMTNKLEDNTLNSIRKIYLENFSKKIVNIFSHELKPIFGKKLLIQRYPQIQIHVGFKHSTKTFPHCEMMAAHSPYTYNIWMPFHDIIDNSGIFLIDDVTSVKLCDKEIKKNVKDREKLVSKNVFLSDEFYKHPNGLSKENLIKKSSIIIVAVPHSKYKNLKIPKNKIVIDTWGIIKKQ